MTDASPVPPAALYVLAYPQADAVARVETFRRRHESARASLVRAHVTLVFGVPREPDAGLLAHIGAVARAGMAFDLAFDRAAPHAGPSPAERHLFLLAGQGASQLFELYAALNSGPLAPWRRNDPPFTPHMTIATADSDAAITAAVRDVPGLGLPLRGHVDALSVELLRDGRLHTVATVPLGHA